MRRDPETPTLFSPGPTRLPAGVGSTSIDAHRTAARRAANVRAQVLTVLQEHAAGLTDCELESLLPRVSPSGVRGRRVELVRAGVIVNSGLRRRTPCYNWAIVWVAVADGRGEVRYREPAATPPANPHLPALASWLRQRPEVRRLQVSADMLLATARRLAELERLAGGMEQGEETSG